MLLCACSVGRLCLGMRAYGYGEMAPWVDGCGGSAIGSPECCRACGGVSKKGRRMRAPAIGSGPEGGVELSLMWRRSGLGG